MKLNLNKAKELSKKLALSMKLSLEDKLNAKTDIPVLLNSQEVLFKYEKSTSEHYSATYSYEYDEYVLILSFSRNNKDNNGRFEIFYDKKLIFRLETDMPRAYLTRIKVIQKMCKYFEDYIKTNKDVLNDIAEVIEDTLLITKYYRSMFYIQDPYTGIKRIHCVKYSKAEFNRYFIVLNGKIFISNDLTHTLFSIPVNNVMPLNQYIRKLDSISDDGLEFEGDVFSAVLTDGKEGVKIYQLTLINREYYNFYIIADDRINYSTFVYLKNESIKDFNTDDLSNNETLGEHLNFKNTEFKLGFDLYSYNEDIHDLIINRCERSFLAEKHYKSIEVEYPKELDDEEITFIKMLRY